MSESIFAAVTLLIGFFLGFLCGEEWDMMYVIAFRAAAVPAVLLLLIVSYFGFYRAMQAGRVMLAAVIGSLVSMCAALVTVAAMVMWGVL